MLNKAKGTFNDGKVQKMKYESIEEIRIALGLLPFDEWGEKVYGVRKERERRCGRTTHMLLKALLASQTDTVHLSAYNASYTHDLVNQARRMAVTLGLDPMKIVAAPSSATFEKVSEYMKGRDYSLLFRDHYYKY